MEQWPSADRLATSARTLILLSILLIATFFIAGCAQNTPARSLNDTKNGPWAGRISLQVQSDPPQSFFAGFELKGTPEKGELTLVSPIGSVIGVMHWSPGEAILESGREVRSFASVDALLAQTTGAAIPVNALFAWLEGNNTSQYGWTADLSRQSEGRITAKRTDPAPQAELRIVLDQ
ncbi:MAG: outer membrane lipoprotein LolB [Polaromonas sp.]